MDFYEKYIALCNEIGKTPSAVALEMGLSKPSVHRWKNGGSPTDATLAKIASYFGVSVAYLLGKEQKKPTIEVDSGIKENKLSMTKKEFIKRVEGMSDAQIERLEQILALVEKTEL